MNPPKAKILFDDYLEKVREAYNELAIAHNQKPGIGFQAARLYPYSFSTFGKRDFEEWSSLQADIFLIIATRIVFHHELPVPPGLSSDNFLVLQKYVWGVEIGGTTLYRRRLQSENHDGTLTTIGFEDGFNSATTWKRLYGHANGRPYNAENASWEKAVVLAGFTDVNSYLILSDQDREAPGFPEIKDAISKVLAVRKSD